MELVAVDATDCSAKKIYGEFKQCMISKQIPISNIIEIACDGANVMVGRLNSFVLHLKVYSPNLIVMQCICHSAAVIASKATSKLPRLPEDLIRTVYSYVSGSAKRKKLKSIFKNNGKNIKISRYKVVGTSPMYSKTTGMLVKLDQIFSTGHCRRSFKKCQKYIRKFYKLNCKRILFIF